MRHRLTLAFVLLALLALFLGHLADWESLLATRDIPIFHLPLRAALQQAAESGFPTWNQGIHGGQPILSNPNYAAFYPPTWLFLLVPVHYSISLVILLHAALAFLGAWALARHLGCSAAPAVLAGIGFTFGGASLATTSLLTTFCGLAWLPWVLLASDRWLRQEGPRFFSRPAVPAAAAFALQILAGEPVIVLTTGLGVFALALASRTGVTLKISRLAVVCLLAVLLAAAQLLPTYLRLDETPRGDGLDPDAVLAWSTAPARFLEIVSPRAWGDPMRIDEGLFFGWSLHDRQYPYLLSIYPGQLVLILAFAGLTLWGIRHRWAWLGMLGAGAFLAIGAHNPVLVWLGRFLPLLSQIRYPEKFMLLATSALVFAAALGWQRMLESREEEGPALEDFPLAVSTFIGLLNLLLLGVLWQRPDVGEWFARNNALVEPGPVLLERAVSFFRSELVAAALAAGSAAVIFALHRWRRVPRAILVPLTLLVLTGDLYYYNHSLTPVVPATDVLTPPAVLPRPEVAGERLFTERSFIGAEPVIFKSPRPGPATVWDQYEHADPYIANLWDYSYAIHRDFDLMATESVRNANSALQASWADPEIARSVLGRWGVRWLASARTPGEILQDRIDGVDRGRMELSKNPQFRQPYRFERTVHLHPTPEAALEADRRGGFLGEHWIAAPDAATPAPSSSRAEILEVNELPASLRISYRSDGLEPLVVARTHHPGWRAGIDGRATGIYRTSLGMIGVFVPPGEHVLELRFREPATLPSLLVSVLTAVALLGISLAPRRGQAAG